MADTTQATQETAAQTATTSASTTAAPASSGSTATQASETNQNGATASSATSGAQSANTASSTSQAASGTSSDSAASNTSSAGTQSANTASSSDNTSSDASEDKPQAVIGPDGFAKVAGIITVYNYSPNDGSYNGETQEELQIGVGIPANSTLVAPPAVEKNQTVVYDAGKREWSVVEDHRGTKVWRKADATVEVIAQVGPVPSTVVTTEPPGQFYTWDDTKGAWEANSAAQAANLKAEAQAMMQTLQGIIAKTGWGTSFSPMPSDVQTYGQAVAAIAQGKDTTSTALPAVPSDLEPYMPSTGAQGQTTATTGTATSGTATAG